jgi:hypothetical protein
MVLLSEEQSQLQASGLWFQFAFSPAKSRFSPTELIKEKLHSLKENRAGNVRREVALNQECNVGFVWGNAVRAVT